MRIFQENNSECMRNSITQLELFLPLVYLHGPWVRGLVYTCPGLSQLSDALREGCHRLLTAGEELADSFEFDHFYVPWLSHSLFGDTFY